MEVRNPRVSCILLWLNLKSDKYLNKLVGETPILLFMVVIVYKDQLIKVNNYFNIY